MEEELENGGGSVAAEFVPIAVDDAVTISEDGSANIAVLENDSDEDGNALRISSVGAPANGTAELTFDGVVYTPNPNFNGEDSFSYTITDDVDGDASATVTVTVESVADAPVLPPFIDNPGQSEDTPVTVDVVGQASDADSTDLVISAIGESEEGTITDNGDGTVTFTPNENFSGTTGFSVEVADETGLTASSQVRFEFLAVNDAPTAMDDAVTTQEDEGIRIFVRDNDTDPEGDLVSVREELATAPTNGTAVKQPNGAIDYMPNPDFNGVDTFSYTAFDPDGAESTAVVTVTVESVPDAPVLLEFIDNPGQLEDQPVTIDILGQATDNDSTELTISAVGDDENGTIVDNSDGTLTYTPNLDFSGVVDFDVTVSDELAQTAMSTVRIEFLPTNDPPLAMDDAVTTQEDQGTRIFVRDNDTDPEGDLVSVREELATAPTNGTAVKQPNGAIDYMPNPDFNGVDTFSYTAFDPDGAESTAVVTVTVESVPDAPVLPEFIDNPDSVEDQAVVVDVLGQATDSDSTELTISSIGTSEDGTVTDNGDGTLTFTPNENFNGTTGFDVQVADELGNIATSTVRFAFASVNDAPIAEDDTATTVDGEGVRIFVRNNDVDPDGDVVSVREEITEAPANGTAVKQLNGAIDYMPNPGFFGTDSFTYTAFDADGAEDTATVTVTVEFDPTAPELPEFIDNPGQLEDQAVTVDVLGEATDSDSTDLSISSIGESDDGTVTDNGDGTVTFTPNENFTGVTGFGVEVADESGLTAASTLRFQFVPVNDNPVAGDDEATTTQGEGVRIFVRDNDTDIDGDIVSVEETLATAPENGTATKQPNGAIDYMPNEGFFGTDSFAYTAIDNNGGSDTATVTVTVTPLPDAGMMGESPEDDMIG